ncbi:transcriptional regulator [Buttiauxella noackiae]|uniref:winged helix-turn-helix domain-containing protein n=1 Tax=Buttiauxella noackiae TaxID=82992 RepID=UPI0035A6AA96
MEYQIFGFLIGKDVRLDIDSRRLYRISSYGTERDFIFGTIIFSETMMQLFLYLLINARNKKVTKEELMKKIWEDNNLSASPQRLWQVLTALNIKLASLGLDENFIFNTKGQGYQVRHYDVIPLYCEKNRDVSAGLIYTS